MSIPGTRSPARLQENVAAAEVTLGPTDLERVHEILPHGSFGSRYPTQYMPQWDDREFRLSHAGIVSPESWRQS